MRTVQNMRRSYGHKLMCGSTVHAYLHRLWSEVIADPAELRLEHSFVMFAGS